MTTGQALRLAACSPCCADQAASNCVEQTNTPRELRRAGQLQACRVPAPMGAAPESKQGRGELLACKGLARNGPMDVKPQQEGMHGQAKGGGNFNSAFKDLIKCSLY